MVGRSAMRKLCVVLALAALAAWSQGCTYLRYRCEDAMELVEIGVTWSTEPYWGVYADCTAILPMGWSHVEGRFAGIGGGQIGVTPHYESAWGLLATGHEEVGWGDYNKEDPATIDSYGAGLVGKFTPPYGRPHYTPACVHYLHLGYFGLVANIRYMDILDFLLGWTTLDICSDDGAKMSQWPWHATPEGAAPQAAERP